MPTRRQFDMTVLVVVLIHPVIGLFKMVANRRVQDNETGGVGKIVNGALQIVS